MLDYFAKRNFSIEQIPDLSGKIAIVTGSNTGVGIQQGFFLFQKLLISGHCRSVKSVHWKWPEKAVECKHLLLCIF